jgi:hypothetical protein
MGKRHIDVHIIEVSEAPGFSGIEPGARLMGVAGETQLITRPV